MAESEAHSNQVLVVCGPTATGKTSLALQLARKFSGDLISADSRQVYRGLDIVTGKDIPAGFKPETINLINWGETTVYTDGRIRIWGLDLIDPIGEWSAGEFRNFAGAASKQIQAENKRPIIVGGTGLYIRTLTELTPLAGEPPDKDYRHQLDMLPVSKLQEKLQQISPAKWEAMNESDQQNPRRLVRALEVAHFGIQPKAQAVIPNKNTDYLILGLTAPKEILEDRIRSRVRARQDEDLAEELSRWRQIPENNPAKSGLGYAELAEFQAGNITRDQLVETWAIHERQYAKRQLTWFRKMKHIHWFDITAKDWPNKLVALVASWYH